MNHVNEDCDMMCGTACELGGFTGHAARVGEGESESFGSRVSSQRAGREGGLLADSAPLLGWRLLARRRGLAVCRRLLVPSMQVVKMLQRALQRLFH